MKEQKVIAVIPARYAATRFPAKLMQQLGQYPVIVHTYNAVVKSNLFSEVFVVTDSDIIYKEIIQRGGKAIMSMAAHESGTDRIAEAVRDMDVDVIVNVQGDEPFMQTEPLQKIVALFRSDAVQVGSLMRKFGSEEEAQNPNAVKVVTGKNGKALYFSRSIIPYNRDQKAGVAYYLHIGVYAFRKEALLKFTTWPQSILEQTEKLEQLRFLENGVDIYMATTTYQTVAIDTPEDLEKAAAILNQ
ncbi:3-deoxy-D-manno-octulosonate cytidylyltransferase [Niabella ginsenosidivorans]|uniref:3-deoxy-manno-octulosonate cytidylyltransferase n=1 Tax=Niabella ginsenosidivorans TaxID=1176587 RepID=A0A1A9I8J8_9BACT|nr:3-deoxy-manno-octulosonate cytidylyltransferase [Niabella ginsenosidivorans]ANH82992.1 3-deoxy-D-manno-octulosonate cytidylyltransferase [Niabella ginsenosidivorans]